MLGTVLDAGYRSIDFLIPCSDIASLLEQESASYSKSGPLPALVNKVLSEQSDTHLLVYEWSVFT